MDTLGWQAATDLLFTKRPMTTEQASYLVRLEVGWAVVKLQHRWFSHS